MNERDKQISKMPEWTQQAFLFLPAHNPSISMPLSRRTHSYWLLTYLHTTLPLPFEFFPLDGSKRDSTQDIGFEV